jgi:hypothetical protein
MVITGSNNRPKVIGRSQPAEIVVPAPSALTKAIQQIGHFGISAVSKAGTIDVPIGPEALARGRIEYSFFIHILRKIGIQE